MNATPRFYKKIGGDITYGCQRLAQGLNALGAIAVVYRGASELAETGISLAPGMKFGSEEFKGLIEKILDNCYAESIRKPDRACQMLAEATEAEDVILFVIHNDGAVSVKVSSPKTSEFVAAMALGIANGLDQMN